MIRSARCGKILMFPYIAGAKRGIAKAKLRNGNIEREWHRPAIDDSNGFASVGERSHPDFQRAFGHNTIAPMTSFVLIGGNYFLVQQNVFGVVGHVGDVLPASRGAACDGPQAAMHAILHGPEATIASAVSRMV
jgi:hypothetical protein